MTESKICLFNPGLQTSHPPRCKMGPPHCGVQVNLMKLLLTFYRGPDEVWLDSVGHSASHSDMTKHVNMPEMIGLSSQSVLQCLLLHSVVYDGEKLNSEAETIKKNVRMSILHIKVLVWICYFVIKLNKRIMFVSAPSVCKFFYSNLLKC